MHLPLRFLAPVLACSFLMALPASAQTIVPIGGIDSFQFAEGVAVDGSGNLFITEQGSGLVQELEAAGGYTKIDALNPGYTGFQSLGSLAIDSAGNLFVPDYGNNLVAEIKAAGGYSTVKMLGVSGNFNRPVALALDKSENVFVTDQSNGVIKEITAASGYTNVITLPATVGQLSVPGSLAVDHNGNVFIADTGNAAVKEVLAAGGYTTIKTIGTGGYGGPVAVALDSAGNVFVLGIGRGAIKEILAAGGYVTQQTVVAPGIAAFDDPQNLVLDGKGDIFVTDTINGTIEEIPYMPPTPIAASILPNSRAVQIGTPATMFATMINTSGTALSGCDVTLDLPYFSLAYQTTDPATNALTGTANQPATIAGGGLQTFLLSFSTLESTSILANTAQPRFACQNTTPAQILPDLNTVTLTFVPSPTLDVIALSATASNDGTVHVANGAGAFAVATIDAGAAGSAQLFADTGSAVLPLTATICQTNSAGQCLAPAAASVSVNYTAGATPTFSIFVSATAAIPFDPVDSRIFVRKGSSFNSVVLSSVAVTTD